MAQRGDRGKAVAFVEMIVGDDRVGQAVERRQRRARLGQFVRGRDAQPHWVSSARMPSSTRGSLSIARTRRPLSASGATARLRRARLGAGARRRAARRDDQNTEPRPGHERTAIGWPSTRPSRSTIDRPRPRPRATRAPCSSRWNSSNTSRCWLAGMPRPVSHTSIRTWRAEEPPAADQDAAFGRVFERVGDEILQQAAHQPPVGADREPGRVEPQVQPLGARSGANSTSSWRKRSATGKSEISGLVAPASRREMSSSAKDLLDRLERSVDVARQLRALLAADWAATSASELA